MVMNVGMQFSQTDGLSVRDKVYFVAALGQFNSELGGDNSAASVGRIAGYSDLHPGPFSLASWLSDSMVTGLVRFRFWDLVSGEPRRK
jgi:hypothetical protein